jgi:hypothetical protein
VAAAGQGEQLESSRETVRSGGSLAATLAASFALSIGAMVGFVGVAVHEFGYAGAHPYAYGPAKVIAWAACAGAVLALAVALLVRALRAHFR